MTRLICVIGHGINLIPHFIDHYSSSVDEINFVVYSSDLYPNLKSEVEQAIGDSSKARIIGDVYHRVFDWEKVTDLYNQYTKRYSNDWWVIADIDEFHLYPINLGSMIISCKENGWEMVRGGFIDRIGKFGDFTEISEDENIFDQFPMAGFFRYPMSGACPNKICIKKGSVEITPGQHYAKINGQTTWRWQGWKHPQIAPVEEYSVQVHHFKWDSTCLERIKKVAENSQEYSFSDEYKIMYDAIISNHMRIDLENPEYMFEYNVSYFKHYKGWNNLINKIISI